MQTHTESIKFKTFHNQNLPCFIDLDQLNTKIKEDLESDCILSKYFKNNTTNKCIVTKLDNNMMLVKINIEKVPCINNELAIVSDRARWFIKYRLLYLDIYPNGNQEKENTIPLKSGFIFP